jgi:uncharacterized protein with von Willebrand factor type A (vWA) domain
MFELVHEHLGKMEARINTRLSTIQSSILSEQRKLLVLVERQVVPVLILVQTILTRMEASMANDFSKLQAAVAQESTVIDSAITLLNGLAEQIRNLPAEQGAIDALARQVQDKTDVLAQAVATNTGAAGLEQQFNPPPAPEPAPVPDEESPTG